MRDMSLRFGIYPVGIANMEKSLHRCGHIAGRLRSAK